MAGEVEILYSDDDILVVNKPCGVSTQGGKNAGMPLDELLCKALGGKVYLVHRLDRDTAGLMIVAKTSAAAARWSALVSTKAVQKEYLSICFGVPRRAHGIINTPIDKCTLHGRETKDAATEYSVISSACYQREQGKESIPLSVVRCTLLTGRNHQIRIHLSSIGNPIVGDDKHGNFAMNKTLRREWGIKHLCLASIKLTLPPPTSRIITLPPPPHMQELIRLCGMNIMCA